MKILKNIGDKDEEQLKIIGDKTNIKSQTDFLDEYLTPEAGTLIKEIKSMGDDVDHHKLLFFAGGNKKVHDFKNFKTFGKLFKDLHNRNMTIDKAKIKQHEFAEKLDKLRAYQVRWCKYTELKVSVSKNVKKWMGGNCVWI